MLLALFCALVANVSYGLGTILQAVGARRTTASAHLDVKLFARLSQQMPYVVGLGLDAIGFIASIIALRTLPLFVVQAAIGGSIGVTALVAVLAFGFHLRRSDTYALVVLMFGLALLSVSARAEHPSHLGHVGAWLLLGGVGVVALGGVLAARLRGTRAGIGLAACAGLGFTGTAVAARSLHIPTHHAWHIVVEPVAIALVLYGVCGMLMFASALQRGSVTATSAVMLGVETIVPSLVGLVALGDTTRAHFAPVAIVGFACTVGASLMLARHTETAKLVEPDPEPDPAPS